MGQAPVAISKTPQNPHNWPLAGPRGRYVRCEGLGRAAVRFAPRCSRAGAVARPPGAVAK